MWLPGCVITGEGGYGVLMLNVSGLLLSRNSFHACVPVCLCVCGCVILQDPCVLMISFVRGSVAGVTAQSELTCFLDLETEVPAYVTEP